MTKLLIGIAIGLLLGVFGCYSLIFFTSHEIISNDYARVTIRNESGRDAKRIILQHAKGSMEALILKDKEEVEFIFINTGESSYNVTVTLDNDLVLVSKSVYIEYGYRGLEIINASEIITENNW